MSQITSQILSLHEQIEWRISKQVLSGTGNINESRNSQRSPSDRIANEHHFYQAIPAALTCME